MYAIILAAGQGTRLQPLTNNLPKCMVPLKNEPLIQWQIKAIRAAGISDIVIVGGYFIERLNVLGTKIIANPHYSSTNMVQSLLCAEEYFGEEFIMTYGDIAYNSDLISSIISSSCDIGVVVDLNWKDYWMQRSANFLSDAESLQVNQSGKICSIGQKVKSLDKIEAQYIGVVLFRTSGIKKMKQLIKREKHANEHGNWIIAPDKTLINIFMTDLLQGLINEGTEIDPIFIQGGWLEIDTVSDLLLAEKLTSIDKDTLKILR